LDGLPYDDRSQAVVLNKGVPIISKVNNEEIGIFNNQRFKVLKYDAFTITIEDDFKKELKINIPDFQNIFYQGMPLRPTVLKVCQLVNHIQFMNGIEWTNA